MTYIYQHYVDVWENKEFFFDSLKWAMQPLHV